MNPRVTTIVTGIIITGLGMAGLLYPDRVMGLLGFAVLNTTQSAAVLGEVRATYGGLFVVMGLWVLLGAFDPVAHRARIQFAGLLWLGACAGRLFGVYLDGSPGIPGWVAAAGELVVGSLLVAVPWMKPGGGAPAAAPVSAPPPPAQPGQAGTA